MKILDKLKKNFAVVAIASLVLQMFLLGATPAYAAVTVTAATGGTGISADNMFTGTYTPLGNMVITENSDSDFHIGDYNSLVLTTPTNWSFKPTTGLVTATAGNDINTSTDHKPTIIVTASTITISYRVDDNEDRDTMTISGIQVIPTSGIVSGTTSNIYKTSGTDIHNILSTTSFGALSLAVGAVSASNSTVSATTPIIANGVTTSTVTVTAKDRYNNLVSGKSVTLTSTGSNNTIVQPGATNLSGVATGTVASTTAEAKTISASVGGTAVTQTALVNFTTTTANLEVVASPVAGGVASITPYNTTASAQPYTAAQTPNPGYTFTGWSGSDCPTGTFALNSTATVICTAIYIPTTLANLSVVANPVAGGVVGGGGSFDTTLSSQNYTATQVANPGYTLTGWTGGYCESGTFAISSVESRTCTANYTLNTYAITSSHGTRGNISPDGITTKDYGSSQTYTMNPNTGYHVETLTVNGVPVTPALSYTFADINSTNTIAVTFAINTYTITSQPGENGSITPSADVNYGGFKLFTMYPNTGYHVKNVIIDGDSKGALPFYLFLNVKATHTIDVTFEINSYALVSSHGTHGSISPDGLITKTYGSNQTYTITPDTGYHISNVSVDLHSVDDVESYSFNNIKTPHVIYASFAPNNYTITFNSDGGTPVADITQGYGTTITPLATNPTRVGYVFDGWTPDFPTTMPLGGASLTAQWVPVVVIATYNASTGGTINGLTSSSQAFNYGGDTTEVTAIPDVGYHFVKWSDNSTDNPRVDTDVITSFEVTAEFEINAYTLNYNPEAHGTISGTRVQSVNYGSDASTVTAVPDLGYHFTIWSDGATTASRKDSNVQANKTLSASFALNTFIPTTTTFATTGVETPEVAGVSITPTPTVTPTPSITPTEEGGEVKGDTETLTDDSDWWGVQVLGVARWIWGWLLFLALALAGYWWFILGKQRKVGDK